MSRFIRISLTVVVLILLAAIIVGAILLVVTVRRPFAQAAGTIAVPGLQDEVHIYRDEWGIPHIYAQNEHDLFFAQGYIHAQDRFWQMEFWRHIGQGRMSEIAGEATLDFDKFIRTVGWNRMAADAETYYEEEAPELMTVLEAYSAGVNAYVEENRGELSLNYTILGLVNDPWQIEPWTPVNTLSWTMVMAHDLSANYQDELLRAELIKELGEATVATLLPPYPYDERPVIVPVTAMDNKLPEANAGPNPAVVDWSRINTDIVGQVPGNGFALGGTGAVGSNNWVVSGEHTATGWPLLANDPHLGVQMPSIWYEVGLHAPGWNVVGFSFAGVPGVVIGHNEHIAWGFTNARPDTQDLYIEKVNPSNPLQYEFMGEWEDMEVLEEVIKVNGGADVVLKVQITRHGPIISEVVDGQSDVLAFKWAAFESPRIFQSLFLLNQAKNYDEFREALRLWDTPSQNVVYADVDGNIAYQTPGRIPTRKNGNGQTPVPGWTGEYEWEGWIPYEHLPAMLNPEQGYIVTANHAVVEPEYPYLIAAKWGSDGDRAQRITELIEEMIVNGDISADDFARIQFDSKSLLAATYVPLFAGLSSDDNQVQAAIERLRGWDLQERHDSVPAALFEIFFIRLAHNVLADDVGNDNVLDVIDLIFFHDLAGQPDAAWWDDTTTPARETREDILLRALAETIDWFEENVGGDMNDWTWGSIHTITFVSDPLGQSGVSLIESLVNRGPFPADGGRSIVNANGWERTDPAVVTNHPSMRMIVDMSDFDAGRTVIPTGQSGHPYHPHYDDMIELWLNGEYHPMRFSREAVEAAAVDHLVLQPKE